MRIRPRVRQIADEQLAKGQWPTAASVFAVTGGRKGIVCEEMRAWVAEQVEKLRSIEGDESTIALKAQLDEARHHAKAAQEALKQLQVDNREHLESMERFLLRQTGMVREQDQKALEDLRQKLQRQTAEFNAYRIKVRQMRGQYRSILASAEIEDPVMFFE